MELAAKPALLFLDEPTSGLDSQTSWAICDLVEKLTKAGQAVLCTIHQPSAMLFERFDRLLLLHNGGKTIYFGDIGENSRTVIKYFEERCEEGRRCPEKANPAEWLLEVIGAAPGCSSEVDWAQVWRDSQEHDAVYQELVQLKEKPVGLRADNAVSGEVEEYREFAAPFSTQMREVTKRVFQQYWRTPTYIYSKFSTCLFSVRPSHPIPTPQPLTPRHSPSSSGSSSSPRPRQSKASKTPCSPSSCSSPSSANSSSNPCPSS